MYEHLEILQKMWVEKCIYVNTDHKIKIMALDIKKTN